MPAKAEPRKNTKWRDEHYVVAHSMATAGHTDADIAGTLGVSPDCLKRWRVTRPALNNIIKAARHAKSGPMSGALGTHNHALTFRDYVYRQLPPDLAGVWNELEICSRGKLARERVEAMFEGHGVRVRQQLFIYAWTQSNFNIGAALRKVCIPKRLFDKWCMEAEFAELVDEIQWHKDNFFEARLIDLVAQGNDRATIHVAKTRLRDRGYGEHSRIDVTGKLETSTTIDVGTLDLPLEARVALLTAMRYAREREAEKEKTIDGHVAGGATQ